MLQRALVEVPVREVELGITHDREIREEPWREIKPPLIHEIPPRRINAAVAAEPVRPPVQESLHLRPGGQRDVAEVVDAGDHHVDLTGAPAVLGDRLGVVGDEDDAVRGGSLLERLQRTEDLDVRIQVGDRLARLREQVAQQPGLDRRGEFQHRVTQRHVDERVAPDVLGRQDVERFLRRVDVPGEVVDDERRETSSWMDDGKGSSEDSSMRQIILGDDGADVQDSAKYQPYPESRLLASRQ